MRSFRFISRAAAVLMAAILLLPAASSAQGKNYPETLLKGKKYVKVTDVKQFDKASGAVKEYLRTLSNGVKVPIRVESAYTFKGNDSLYVNFGRNVADYPIRPEGLKKIYEIVKNNLPSNLKNKKLAIFAAGSKLEHLMTPFYNPNSRFAKTQKDGVIKVSSTEKRLKEQEGKPFAITKGLQDRHIAMQNSHGWYYEPTLDRWEFQRARLFGVVEDTYTMSYVEPFLVPMLENAGAVVLLPKERDWTKVEVIVDNDTQTAGYSSSVGSYAWSKGDEPGFAHPKKSYTFGENPFKMGSYMQVEGLLSSENQDKAGKSLNPSTITWTPKFEEDGDYAVYISYHTLPSSADNVSYTVKYSGGQAEFSVNQKMGGSMWIYLGTFHFKKGNQDQGVTLTNAKSYGTVTADACKFGGGMGNIARGEGEGFVSGMPRFLEGARYFLQWSGFADTVYSMSHNENDYTDDYVSRGKFVNAIAGGSKSLRRWGAESRHIPVDLSFAFHTDAGNALSDTIIGTLSIYTRTCKDFGGENLYPNGDDRILGRYLADIVQTQLVDDITDKYGFAWSRRQLWDRSYSESRSPQVPGMLLEFLSHHNYADMKFGLDPDFRFTASRAIYKGILKFLAMKNNVPYTVQPLPVNEMQVVLDDGQSNAIVTWSPVEDKLEPTATPTGYVVYTAIDDNGFDLGKYVAEPKFKASIKKDHIYRFKVTAVNEGGESFPSEVVAAGVPSQIKSGDIVLVVNAFDRVGAPKWIQSKDSTMAGFFADYDHGVPYLKDASYLGKMYEYRRDVPWTDDDAPGFGACYSDQAGNVIAGNTFDYAYDHGLAFMHNGYAFISSTRSAVENGKTDITKFNICDLILGKQCQSNDGALTKLIKYHAYTPELKKALKDFCSNGRNLLVSGAYVATDLVDAYEVDKKEGPKFLGDVLKIKWMTHSASTDGKVASVRNDFGFDGTFEFWSELNDKKYVCEAPDAFTPAGKDSYTIFRYPQTSISAAVAYPGKNYKTVVFGFPIETLKTQDQIDKLIGQTLNFFTK
ncbi:MAG: xanthan lyase [Bacteroidales bacterium]|nr:xanthan lyase [Bacteroidales bacterium]